MCRCNCDAEIRVLVFHMYALIAMAAIVPLYKVVALPEDFRFNPLGLIYLTTHVCAVVALYFFGCVHSLLMYKRELGRQVRTMRGYAAVSAVFMFCGFYTLVYPSSIYTQLANERNYFSVLMHMMHAMPLALVAVECLIAAYYGERHDQQLTLRLCLGHGVFYFVWTHFLYTINEKWPYPFMDKLSYLENVGVGFGALAATVVFVVVVCKLQDGLVALLYTPEKKGKAGESKSE